MINKALQEKVREALSGVLPVSLIILLLAVTAAPLSLSTTLFFLVGAVLLIVGMGLFSLGADMAMMPMGEALGRRLAGSRNTWRTILIFFLVGVLVTVAEPDLSVLAEQVPGIPNAVLVWTVAAGVGFFLGFCVLRTALHLPLKWVLLVFYGLVFGLSFFVPRNMLAVAFDSGGVTTGPITVPFILALGVGLSTARSGSQSEEDSFGVVALASIGPILAVLILGLLYQPDSAVYHTDAIPDAASSRSVALAFLRALPAYGKEVLVALLPITGLFALFQWKTRALKRRRLARIGVGLIYTFAGLVLFLTGVNVGFLPAGRQLGLVLGGASYRWALIPLGALLGWFIVQAEPAVHVLSAQVESVTGGAVSKFAMRRFLSVGMAISIALSMARILLHIPLYWILIPGYGAALGLGFAVPAMFTGIAFDSGGVASGPMTAAFLLPFAMGACQAVGGDILMDAFGVVALVAMTPLLTIQLMGLRYSRKVRTHSLPEEEWDEILEYDVSCYRTQEVTELG